MGSKKESAEEVNVVKAGHRFAARLLHRDGAVGFIGLVRRHYVVNCFTHRERFKRRKPDRRYSDSARLCPASISKSESRNYVIERFGGAQGESLYFDFPYHLTSP